MSNEVAQPVVTPAADDRLPLSDRLRNGTREAHERVEATASFNRLIVVRIPDLASDAPAPEIARFAAAMKDYREVYRRFLIASHGFETAVDEQIAAPAATALAVANGFSPETQSSPSLIRADLTRVFGADAARDLGAMQPLAPIRTLPELIGTEYVRRGSRAGGAFISAIVQKNLGFTREDGASFLAQYGKETRSVITAFKAWADAFALPEVDAQAAVARAVETFLAVEQWHAQLEERFARG